MSRYKASSLLRTVLWYHNREKLSNPPRYYHFQCQAAGSDAENFLSVGLWEHETVYHQNQMDSARDEEQYLYMQYDRQFETQRITFSDMAAVPEVSPELF